MQPDLSKTHVGSKKARNKNVRTFTYIDDVMLKKNNVERLKMNSTKVES